MENLIDEKIEINKELTKKDIAAILVTLVGQLGAIANNANCKTSMYSSYIEKALVESGAKDAIKKLKTEVPKYTNGVEFKLNEALSKEEKDFNSWLSQTPFVRQAKYYGFDDIWSAKLDDGFTLCMSPLNKKGYDERMIGWNTNNGKVIIYPENSIAEKKVKEGAEFLSKIWQKYKSKKFNY